MGEKKKIIIVGPGHPYRNGQSIYLGSLCNKLKGKFNVELINFSLLYPSFLFPGKTQFDESKERKIQFPNKRLLSSLNPVSWYKTAQYINRQNPDLIAIDWWHPFVALCFNGVIFFLSRRNKKKVVFITENVISHEGNKTDTFLTKLALRHANAFLALSESVEKHLHSFFEKKIYRSALPIYRFYKSDEVSESKIMRNQYGYGNDDIVLLFFGLVRKYKGLDLLLEAYKNLIEKYPGLKLVVVGEFYEPIEYYENLINTWGIRDKVVIENRYVPDEGVAPYFEMCDCVVLPYKSATQSGILSVAYGFGKPVVVTDVGELANMVIEGSTGTVAKYPNVDSIEDAIERFIQLKNENLNFENNIQKYLAANDEFEKVDTLFDIILNDINRKT